MNINENSILASINPVFLIIAMIVTAVLAWICARYYRNTNDFKKSVKLYLPCLAAADIFFLFGMEMDWILCIGLDICGLIVLGLISNYYFYH